MKLLIGRIIAILLYLSITATAVVAETTIPPAPTAWVTDSAKLLSAQTIEELNSRLRAYQSTSKHQILVYIAPTTGGAPLEDWTVRAFAQWKVGRKGLDDGLVMFLFPLDRAARIEVGYGLEGAVPDALASRVVRETIDPEMLAGRPDQAVKLGLDQILRLAGGEATSDSAAATANAQDDGPALSLPLTPLQLVLIGFGVLALLLLAIKSPWMALYLLMNIFGARGGMSGGGAFSGGGGRSGGGGASGRW